MSVGVSVSDALSLAPVVLVMGKGGVGKTTVAAGLASLTARSSGRSVLVEFGDGAPGRRALGENEARVEHLVIRPQDAVARGAAPLFGSSTVSKLVLGNFAMKPLLKAAPAVRELAMLESVRQIAAARPGVRVVVDMPATGHSVAWLRIPRQGREFLASGPIFEMCERIGVELLHASRSSVVVVTLPEPLVLEETLELCDALDAEVRVDCLIVNRVTPALPASVLAEAQELGRRSDAVGEAARWLSSTLEARVQARRNAIDAISALSGNARRVRHLPSSVEAPSAEMASRWLASEGLS